MTVDEFHNGRVALWRGDCLEALAQMPENSIDSCATDPPYHLTSIVKRFGGKDAAPVKIRLMDGQAGSPFARAATGFMGKQWDGGDIAFRPDVWREVYRVLKPGAHLLAFGGTRTFDMLGAAIRAAGFEVRDTIAWIYSQGFPKNHSLNKQPICECDNDQPLSEYDVQSMRKADLSATEYNGKEQSDVLFSCVSEQSLSEHRPAWAESESSRTKQSGLGGRIIHRTEEGLSDGAESRTSASESKRLCVGAHSSSGGNVRPIIGTRGGSSPHQSRQGGQSPGEPPDLFEPSRPLDDGALRGCGACPRCGKLKKEFEGFGTALKPAMELICLARKPLSESTVAANVLKWGTGALNIDGCRVVLDNDALARLGKKQTTNKTRNFGVGDYAGERKEIAPIDTFKESGRWSANLIHDGSEEVLAEFPETQSGALTRSETARAEVGKHGIYGKFNGAPDGHHFAASEGSASRFFYTAKADSDDRLGSKHPTVKPLDLMQYLVRLVTPKGGVTLDPFAGTGTTGEAAFRECMRAVLIEREPEYQDDIARRMALVLAGPDERANAAIKQRMKDKPRDDGPLFAT